MNIFIGCDSRGFNVEEDGCKLSGSMSWANMFIKHFNAEHKIKSNIIDKNRSRRLVSLFTIKKDMGKQHYDLAIIQSGLNEIASWKLFVWEGFNIKQNHLTNIKLLNRNPGKKKSKSSDEFILTDLHDLRDLLSDALLNTDRCLYLGAHSWRRKKGDWKHPMFHKRVLEMNNIISNTPKVDFINMPVSIAWRKNHCCDDLHYDVITHKIVFNTLVKYVECFRKTVPDILESIL